MSSILSRSFDFSDISVLWPLTIGTGKGFYVFLKQHKNHMPLFKKLKLLYYLSVIGASMGWTQKLLKLFLELRFQQRTHTNQEPPSAALTQVDKTVTCPVLRLSVYKQEKCLHRNQVYNGIHSRCRICFSRKAICSQDLAVTLLCTSNTHHYTFRVSQCRRLQKASYVERERGLRRKKERAAYIVIKMPKRIPC